MKTAFYDTLKNGRFQYEYVPQKTLDLIEYIQFLDKIEKLLYKNIF